MSTGVYQRSEEHCRKIGLSNSKALRGRKLSEQHKKHISEALERLERKGHWFGKDLSTEHKTRISLSKKGKKQSEEHRRKNSLSKSGERHYRWIPDRTQLVKSTKKHLDSRYRDWSRAVKNRDDWKCRMKNSHCSGRLEAHHILRWANYPDLRYSLENGIALCHYHHPRTRHSEDALVGYFKKLISRNETN